jgi:ubiquitin carboxyl-terminal hydrolase MINDY-3/4
MNNSAGQSLGGFANDLTPDEIRGRRMSSDTTTGRPPAVVKVPSSNEMDQGDDDDDDDGLQAALSMSMQKDDDDDAPMTPYHSVQSDAANNSAPDEAWNTIKPLDISEFHSIMWDSFITTDSDKNRWVGQGIDTRPNKTEDADHSAMLATRLDHLGASHIPWGLIQAHGGPCGVLAAIQAELLRILLFGTRDPLDYPKSVEENPYADSEISQDLIRNGLALSIAITLARAALMPPATEESDIKGEATSVRIVLPAKTSSDGLCWGDLQPWSPEFGPPKSTVLSVYTLEVDSSVSYNPKRQRTNGGNLTREQRIVQLAHRVTRFLLSTSNEAQTAPLDHFRKPGGVILLVMSLVCSRGSKLIQSEFDDQDGTKLTSQFGHCGQELMNLLLTGQAVSNVFDNTMKPSGDLTCRGIQSRPMVGYLTQLEALRYCESGGYYKSPLFPIWVVGSTSHFTVLFGDASCLKESKSDELLEKCRRAFKAMDNEENGFISRIELDAVLHAVGVDISDHGVQTLAATLEVSGADIILWDSFWKAASRLLMGASLESVVQGDDEFDASPPRFGVDHDNGDQKPEPAPATRESDEEMAKRLAAEWGDTSVASALPASKAAGALSDEELARRLQAEWDAELSGGGSVVAVSGSPSSRDLDLNTATLEEKMPGETIDFEKFGDSFSLNHHNGLRGGTLYDATHSTVGDDLTAATLEEDVRMPGERVDFEKFGESFPLYHYNGLRGGTLTPFRVTRMTAEEAVGASIALGASSSVGGGDLEDVVRTKWPSCVVNWLGKTPPYID